MQLILLQANVQVNKAGNEGELLYDYDTTNIKTLCIQSCIVLLFSGQTPLHIAISQGHKECMQLLLEKGADVNKADKEGEL